MRGRGQDGGFRRAFVAFGFADFFFLVSGRFGRLGLLEFCSIAFNFGLCLFYQIADTCSESILTSALTWVVTFHIFRILSCTCTLLHFSKQLNWLILGSNAQYWIYYTN